MEPREEKLTVVESCPGCGGRVSAIRDQSGKLSAMCIGTFGDEIPCGWTTENRVNEVTPMKQTG